MTAWLNKHANNRGSKIIILNKNSKAHCLTSSQYTINLGTDFIPVSKRKPIQTNNAIEFGKAGL